MIVNPEKEGDDVRLKWAKMARTMKWIAVLLILLGSVPIYAEVTPGRQKELRNMMQHDCGSCHGLTRKGGLGPPLTVDALEGRTTEVLFKTIRDGVNGTPMPPWQDILDDEEILWIINQLKEDT